jgi:pSer/pThr/pTyr-binding forkhead associated (FHA) protein
VNFDAHMRIGSLEILAALIFFGAIAARIRPSAARQRVSEMRLLLNVRDAVAGTPREVAVTIGERENGAIVGRASGATIGLLDPEVSRRHARFELARGVVYLTDLQSSNGTFLNGKLLGNEGGIEVRPGDDIDVGNTRISVVQAEPAAWT